MDTINYGIQASNPIHWQLKPFTDTESDFRLDENVIAPANRITSHFEEHVSKYVTETFQDLIRSHKDMSPVVKMSKPNTNDIDNKTFTADEEDELVRNGNNGIENDILEMTIDRLMCMDSPENSLQQTNIKSCYRTESTVSPNTTSHNVAPVQDNWLDQNETEITNFVLSVISKENTNVQSSPSSVGPLPDTCSGDLPSNLKTKSANELTASTEHDTINHTDVLHTEHTGNHDSKEVISEEPSSKSSTNRKRGRRKDPAPCQDPFPVMLPPCRVCNERASGFHYGANTCEACKGFFRRTLVKKRVLFPCRCKKEEKEAWRTGPVRNGCPSCRYERCLHVGMDRKAIKIGRYTLMRKTENIKEVKTLERFENIHHDSLNTDSPSRRPPFECHRNTLVPLSSNHVTEPPLPPPMKQLRIETPAFDWTNIGDIGERCDIAVKDVDEIVRVLLEVKKKQCCKHFTHTSKSDCIASIKKQHNECYERYTLKTALFGEMKPLSQGEHMEIYRATGIDIDDRFEDIRGAVEFFEKIVRALINFGKAIPGFKDLELDDQASLIKATRVESSFLGGYRRFLMKCNMDLQVTLLPWGKAYHLNELTKIYPKEFILLRFILAREIQSLGLTFGEEMIVRAIAITNGERCQLKEPSKVVEINRMLYKCLHCLLSKRRDDADEMMFKVLELFGKFRNLRELDNKVSRELFLGLPSLSNYHLLTEFFS